ncbi:MAG: pyruvate kinase [Anaerolineae bacterium]
MTIRITETRPRKKTKIVATIGPASDNPATLRRMINAGLDVVRINFSHGKPEAVVELVKLVRSISDEMDVPIAVLGDLRGPRIRLGEIENGSMVVEDGQKLILCPQDVTGTKERVSVSYPKLAQDVSMGCVILVDDGNIELSVESIGAEGEIICRVVEGGKLSSRRGLNLPGQHVNLPSLTHKDFEDIKLAIEQEFDFLALSFVQSVNDVRLLKAYLQSQDSEIPVIAKIERHNALEDIENIVQEADGVMVARGDLALEMSLQDVPIAQKRIIAACRKKAIPVITATQMLESMVTEHKPTRAEVTDVANAILDGTDAVMLSGETAIGKYPAETVAVMSAIALRTEAAWMNGELPGPPELPLPKSIDGNIAYASHVAAQSVNAKALIIHTQTGNTARRVSCHRPKIPILALSSKATSLRRLALTWGVDTALVGAIQNTKHMVFMSFHEAIESGLAKQGEIIAVTAGTPYGMAGRTNMLKIEEVPGDVSLEEFEAIADD